jgi:uroporphyrinogen-III synthase
MPVASFNDASVLTLESRRGLEMGRLIETYGGRPMHAPAMREVPVKPNPETVQFANDLLRGQIDFVIFLTGVGARALLAAWQEAHPADELFAALRKISVIARGPKPLAVLREWNVPVAVAAPEPNTWRELLRGLDDSKLELRDKYVAVQEYGVSNIELLEELRRRGAHVTPVAVYQWDLPEDQGPLRAAVDALTARRVDIVLLTTSVQVVHLFRIAEEMGKGEALKASLQQIVKASIGPTTSETLASYGLTADLEASHPKMGFLVKEAAEQSALLLHHHRENPPGGELNAL